MAPRNARAKKAADVKVAADGEVQKKGRGKAKNVEETEQEVPDIEINNKNADPDKKSKRGKKANETNGDLPNGDEVAPPAKRGRKKAAEEPALEEKESNGENSAEDGNTAEDQDDDKDDSETVEEAPAPTGKGRKKAAKKEEKVEAKPSGRGRKAKQEIGAGDAEEVETEEKKEVEEKPKGKGRGRKAQQKAEPEPEDEKTEEPEDVETKAEAPAKGKKKGAKAAKEKTPEIEKDETPEEPAEEKPAAELKKKEPKGKKAQGKKAQAKEEVEEKEEEPKEEPASKKRKVSKKEEKAREESKDDEEKEEEPAADVKPAKAKRGQKKAESQPAETQEEPEAGDGKRRRPADKVSVEDTKSKAPLKNKSTTNYEDIDFSNASKTAQGKEWNFKICSWNVDGIRAWLNKGGLDYIKYEKPDILCLQEVKCSKDKLPDEVVNLPGYHAYWLCSDQDGYAGVGIYTTKLAISVQYGLQNEELDSDGRIITAEYEQFYLICTYVPNAGRNLVTLPKRLQWNEEFRKYVKELDKKKPVIICGDMNVAHNEIDLANPKTNKKNAGFTEEERSGMTDLLRDGFVDTFRHMNPDKSGAYTFWTYMKNSRAKNVGWRLDYFIVSERLLPSVCDNVIRDEVYGSDHCPISLFLHLTTADKPKE